jgi:predicted DNA-binding ribbon-helix-helix protein
MVMDQQANPVSIYAGPVKHSVTISGHQTSISLEPLFWDALRRAAGEEGLPVSVLIARIDEQRIATFGAAGGGSAGSGSAGSAGRAHASNLASAIRCWLWARCCGVQNVGNAQQGGDAIY